MKPRNPHALPARQRKGGPHTSKGRVFTAQEAIQEQTQDVRVDVNLEEEQVRGADGRRIRLGVVVRRPVTEHPRWGLVPSAVGRVVRVYRRPSLDPERILVDYHGGGLRTAWADTLRRSTADPD